MNLTTAAPRVLVVARRFWPLAGDGCMRLMSTLTSLKRSGMHVEIVTAGWHSEWPAQVCLREFNVHRIFPAPSTPFRIRRYVRALGDWIAKHASRFDVLYFDAPEEEAAQVISVWTRDNRPPIVCRYSPAELANHWDSELRSSKSLQVVRSCDAVLAPTTLAHQRLIVADVAASRIVPMADPAFEAIDRTSSTRSLARQALADINHELFLRSTDRLVVCPANLTRSGGQELLIRALGPLLEQIRGVKLWLIGDGIERDRLYDFIKKNGWRHSILMPGSFEDMDIILQAADLCVLPGLSDGLGWILPQSIRSGLPILACEGAESKTMLLGEASKLLFRNGDTLDLRSRIESWIDDPRSTDAAIKFAQQQFPTSESTLDAWRVLMARLMRSRSNSL